MIAGTKDVFALECGPIARQQNWYFATLQIWVGGRIYGNSEETSNLQTSVRYAKDFLSSTAKRYVPSLHGKSKGEVFDTVFNSVMITLPSQMTNRYSLPNEGSLGNTTLINELETGCREVFHFDDVGDACLRDRFNIVVVQSESNIQRVIVRDINSGVLDDFNLHAGAVESALADYIAWFERITG